MGQLVVRNLDPEMIRRLKIRAAKRGRSAEAEHREILREALLPQRRGATLKEHLLAVPPVGDDRDFDRINDLGRDVDL